MKPGFILLEAVIAVLIIAMVSLSALEAVQLMNRSVERFRANAVLVQARRNALALARHLERTEKVSGGTVAYGPYVVRWQAKRAETTSYRLFTIAGFSPPIPLAIDRVTFTTSIGERQVDQFALLIPSHLPATTGADTFTSPQ